MGLENSGMFEIACGKDPEGNATPAAELLDPHLGALTVTGSLSSIDLSMDAGDTAATVFQ